MNTATPDAFAFLPEHVRAALATARGVDVIVNPPRPAPAELENLPQDTLNTLAHWGVTGLIASKHAMQPAPASVEPENDDSDDARMMRAIDDGGELEAFDFDHTGIDPDRFSVSGDW